MGYEVLDNQLQKHTPEKRKERVKRTKKLLKLSTYVIAKNNHLLKAIQNKSPNCNVHVFDWGLDNTLFNFENKKISKDFIFLSPRSLNGFYNILDIVTAFYHFTKEITTQNTKLYITEYGIDVAYKAKIIEFLVKKKLEKNVIFIGTQTPNQMATLYKSSNCSVMYPPSDGLPQSLLESLSCGTPVIGPKIDPYTDWLVNESVGLLIPIKNVSELTNSMVKSFELYSSDNSQKIQKACAELMKKVANTEDSGRQLIEELFSN
ncbi:MAG: glycosyltransferase [Flavobacteriales bacterium]|nr:glycosyltransferase [Flavobacteriales bacterium]